jgi:uncharacterized protein (TIGR03435 family)
VRHLLITAGFGALVVLPFAVALAPPVRVEVAPVLLPFDDYLAESILLESESVPDDSAAETAAPTPARWRPNLTTAELVAMVWSAGAVAFTVPLFIGLLQVRRLRRTASPWRAGQQIVDALKREGGLHRPVDVLLHEGIAVPATYGMRRHVILFPIDVGTWSQEDIARAAVHEVEHVRRSDSVVNGFAGLVCAAYWFHPLVWIAWRRLGLEAERACDDAVLSRAEPTGYADQLVTLAGRLSRNTRHPLLAMANRSDLVQRVAAVLDSRQARGNVGTAVACVIGIAACALILAISPLEAVAPSTRYARSGQAPTLAPGAVSAPKFEVATIRINRSGDRRVVHNIVPAAGQVTITNITVTQLIHEAYGVPLTSQLVNVPDWARTMRVDVAAKAASPAPAIALQRMLQPLLAEFFKLSVRRETRDMDVFAMVVANPGRLGSQLRRNDSACEDLVGDAAGFARAPEGAPDQKGTCGILPGGAGRIVARGLDMPGLAAFIGTVPGRMVIDRTGLTGRFDIDLTYTPSAFAAAALAQRPGAAPPPGVDPSGPPLITALREQLGLRLDPVRAPVGVLVIERVVQPSVDERPAGPAAMAPQVQMPAFEVASIRRNTVGFAPDTSRVEGGRYTASNMTLDQLIRDAYRMQTVGGPEWINDPPGPPRSGEIRFDVIATFPSGTPPDRVPLMLRTLLAERFGLVAHTEKQEQPVYALVHARDDRRLGSQLTPSTQQCQVEIEAGPLRAPVRRVAEDGKPVCSMMVGPASIRGGGVTMRFLANALRGPAGRIVEDRTGLEGPFDFGVTWAPRGPAGTPPSPSDDRPSIFVALQEQLGLKLEPTSAAVEVLVIDRVSLPTEN